MEYNGIKIYDEVTIVKNKGGQGYVVEKGNKQQMKSAINWAEGWANLPYTTHDYKNGQFKFIISSAPKYSSQGGKLSFMNCDIIAPDGEKFLVGISSESVVKLLKANDFSNGELKGTCYLGRQNGGQCCAFTENMEEYKMAQEDSKKRDMMKSETTDKYVVGDIVENLNTKEIYAGVLYKYFETKHVRTWGDSLCMIIKLNEPQPYHVMAYSDGEIKTYCKKYKNKPKRIITGHVEFDLEKEWKKLAGKKEDYNKTYRQQIVEKFRVKPDDTLDEEYLKKIFSEEAFREYYKIREVKFIDEDTYVKNYGRDFDED